MPDTPDQAAGKLLGKQGLTPHAAGQPPKIGSEQVFGSGSDVKDASGKKIGEVNRASSDTNGPDSGGFHASVLSDMMDKYGDRVKKYNGGN